jgi:regulation of enolase protein 1 (concanavalin A-like superfamily)
MVCAHRLFVLLMTLLLISGVALAQVDHFKVEAVAGGNIGKERTATPFAIKITAQKSDNSTETTFTGKVNITSTGTLTAGADSTLAFTAGVLSTHNVTFGNTGSFTITAANGVTGTSNSFKVVAFTSDDFDATNLQTGTWTFSDPLGDATLAFQGTGTADARLSLSVPAEVNHDLYTGNNSAPRILQPAANGDFTIQVKFDSPVSYVYEVQGVIVQQDANNLMRFDFSSNGSYTKAFSATTTDGFATAPTHQIEAVTIAPNATSPMWMRVTRSGNSWTMAYSTDGSAFSTVATYTYALTVAEVGLFVANGGPTPPNFTMIADYFFDAADPVSPEDGSVHADVLPPLVYNVSSIAGGAAIQVNWKTDERSTTRIEYGTTTSYGSSVVDATLSTQHSVIIPSLSATTAYNFRIIAIDSLNQKDTTANMKDTTILPTPPAITLWYGNDQTFGTVGTPQRYVNIQGNVTDPTGIDQFYYTLNGGAQVNLSRGPDTRRLQRAGDFNVDLRYDQLDAGANSLVIHARNIFGDTKDTTVTVRDNSGAVWPLPYTVDFTSAGSLTDSVQVTDGRWQVASGKARIVERGYDRVLAIGDTTWHDYEMTAKLSVSGFDSSSTAYDAPSNGPSMAFLMRWMGHTDSPITISQPKEGYLPLGAFAAVSWPTVSTNRWELFGDNLTLRDSKTSPAFLFNTDYYFKLQVKTTAGVGGYYRFKVWKTSDTEPTTWLLNTQEGLSAPQYGSVLIVAHHVSVSVDEVRVTATPADSDPPVVSNVTVVSTSASSAYITWTSDEPSRGKLAYGLTSAYGDTALTDTLLHTTHGVAIAGLNPSSTYHFKALSTDNTGNIGTSTDATFATSAPGAVTTLESDEFNATSLNPRWTFVNPRGDASYATPDTVVQINVPTGAEHDIWTTGYNVPRIMQTANNADFEAIVKWNSPIPTGSTTEYRTQGIIAEQNLTSLARFDYTSTQYGTFVFSATFTALVSDSITIRAYKSTTGATNVAPLYMRVKREGDVWSQYYSVDGTTWTLVVRFYHPMTVTKVGVYAGNAGSAAPAFVGIADYFRTDGVTVNIKALLQGPYVVADDTMRTSISANIPLKNPYRVSPWNYAGNDSVLAVPTGVVDWVLVTLRSGSAASTGVDTVAAFIKKDGSVVGLDGSSAVQFPGVKFGNYFVVLRHRNHLSVMTATVQALNSASPLYDFTVALSKAYSGGGNGMKLAGSRYTMFGANGNGDGVINAVDRNSVWRVQNGSLNGYYSADFNMDNVVNAVDQNSFWRVNNGTLSQVP